MHPVAGLAFRFTFLATMVSVLAAAALAQTNATSPDARTIVDRMLKMQQDNKARVHAFTVKRGYRLLDKQDQEKAQVVANITVLPPDSKQYQIESSSGGMGEKVLRDILTKETEQPRDAQRKELSLENYDFPLLGEETLNGRRCYLMGLNPRREEKDLLRGKIWVDAENYNILRLEGSPAKTPSWWIRDLHILMSFAEVDGMWLRTFTHAVANVRFKGRYVMVSRDLEYRFEEQTASRPRHNPAIFAGSAINP
jgi:hypothetical protein